MRTLIWKPRWLGCLALAILLPAVAHAGIQVHVKGLDEALTKAISSNLTLAQYAKRSVTPAQVRLLYRKAPAEVKALLQPYGYFDADVHGDLAQEGTDWTVTLTVDPGEPVKVTSLTIDLPANAMKLPAVHEAVTHFAPTRGDILNQGKYTQSRDAISAALVAAGFFDARMTTHRVAVTRATHAAVIDLAWDVGTRYRFGTVHFEGSQFRAGFLKRYVPWHPGDYFDQNKLLALQQNLTAADYFSVVDVQPDLAHKHADSVDVDVKLHPAKRSIYTGGPFIGTDTGLGIQLGLQRRWVNDRGHKWQNRLILAQHLKTLNTLYTIPLAGNVHRAWNLGATFRDADTKTSHSKTLELVGNQTGLWHGWLVTAGVHVLSGTFTVGRKSGEPDDAPGVDHGNSTLVYPEVSLVKKRMDQPDFVLHGWSLTLAARSTVGSLLSDTDFSQLQASGKWIHAFTPRNRLLVRAEAGITRTGNFSALPPQLRFFSGGSHSNRGYGYQALGPRNSHDRVIGGTRLLDSGVTFEHYFTPHWGMAAFVDAGNAFDGTDFRPRIGAGLGVRWVSPVGMIRVDFGTPIHNDRHHGIQLNILIGPDL